MMEHSSSLKPAATLPLVINKIMSPDGLGFSVVAFLLSSMLFGVLVPIIRMSPLSVTISEVFLYSLMTALAVILLQVVSTVLYVQSTIIERKTATIEVLIGGFRHTTLSIPLNQLQNVLVHQSILERAFGLVTIQISQLSGFISVWGFPITRAQKFVQQLQQ